MPVCSERLQPRLFVESQFLSNVEFEKHEILAYRENQLVLRGACPPGVYQQRGKFERISTTTRRLWRRANWESSCIHVSFSSTLGKNLNFQPLQKLNFSRVFFARDCRERTQLCKLKTSRVEYNFLLYANLCAN